jgi:hypothetical protein
MLFSRAHKNNSEDLSICTLDGVHIDGAPAYKCLGIWIDEKLSFKKHTDEFAKKLRIKMGFFYRNRSCLSLNSRKQIIQLSLLSMLEYGDIIYVNTAVTSLDPLDAVYHSALRFITGNNYSTHHCILYQKVGWPLCINVG